MIASFVFFILSCVVAIPLDQLGSNATIAEFKDTDVKTVPHAKEFQSKEELFHSRFWKDLLIKKNPQVAQSTVIVIHDTKSAYYFDTPEFTEDSKDNGIKLFPFKKSKKRIIELVEVQYGEQETCDVNDIPVSLCISSRLSSGGASYTQSYSWGQAIKLKLVPSLNVAVSQIGASVSLGIDDLILTLSNTGGITCNADPGRRVQVFASLRYAYFPNAKKRKASFLKGDSDFRTTSWSKLVSAEPNFKGFGAVFFDLSKVPDYYCVDDEEMLMCDDDKALNMQSTDPIHGLRYARYDTLKYAKIIDEDIIT